MLIFVYSSKFGSEYEYVYILPLYPQISAMTLVGKAAKMDGEEMW